MKRGLSTHAWGLWGLLAVFLCRVLSQWIQFTSPVPWLPAFEQWQGSTLSYPLLLSTQLMIVALVAWCAWRLSVRRFIPRRGVGLVLMGIGAVYFTVMGLRLLLGVSLLAEIPWFAKPLPAFFHLILASKVLVLGHYHLQPTESSP